MKYACCIKQEASDWAPKLVRKVFTEVINQVTGGLFFS